VLRRQIGRAVPSGKRETEDPNINVAVIYCKKLVQLLVSDKEWLNECSSKIVCTYHQHEDCVLIKQL